jgi:hypothetical protein
MHIGLEKTGSTYLQSFLQDNAGLLAEQGIGYPDFCRGSEHLEVYMAGRPDISWMHRRFDIRTPEQHAEMRAKVSDGFARMAAEYETSVITCERLSTLRTTESVEHLADLAREHFDRVEIALFVRRPDHAVGSYYGQSVKVGLASRTAPDFMSRQGRMLDLAGILERWQSVFGAEDVHAWPYLERYKSGGDTALGVFFRHIGLTPPTPEDPGPWQRPGRPINVRLSAEATEYVRLLNPRVPRWRTDGRWNGAQRTLLLNQVSARFPGKDAAAPPELVAAVISAYPAQDIADLARRADDPDAGLWDEWLAQPAAEGEEPPTISAADVDALARELFVPRGPILADGAPPHVPAGRRLSRQARKWRRRVSRALRRSAPDESARSDG